MFQSKQLQIQREISRLTRKKSQPYQDLMPFFLDRNIWEAAWKKVQRAEGANTPGVDGETCNGIAPKMRQWLDSLHHQVSHGKYAPQNILEVAIPKSSGGGSRTIGILTITDMPIDIDLYL